MKHLIIVCALVFSIINSVIAQDLSNEERIFFEGVNAGMMSKHEGDVVNAYKGLSFLQKVDGTETYREVLVNQMNTSLFAMSFVDRDVKQRPELLRQLSKISSPGMKLFMSTLKQARSENKWRSADDKQETKIQWVLDRYVLSGNIYGFD